MNDEQRYAKSELPPPEGRGLFLFRFNAQNSIAPMLGRLKTVILTNKK